MASDDAHAIQMMGRAEILVECEERDPDAMLRAIKGGRFRLWAVLTGVVITIFLILV